MWLWSLRNYDGDGNGNENVNWKEKAFIKENNNSGLFQAFRQWRVARNEERRGKKEALSPYSHPSLPTPTPSFLLTPPPLYLLPPPLSSLPHPLSTYSHPLLPPYPTPSLLTPTPSLLTPTPSLLTPTVALSCLLPHFSLRPFHYLNVWNRLILAHFDSVTALLRSEIS